MEKKKNTSDPGLTVLIVDDHQLLRDGLKVMLQSLKKELPMHISEADNGEKALKMAEVKIFELLITDYRMAGMQGDELVRRILKIQPALKVLALSNSNEYDSVEAMIDAGALGYVLKTVSAQQMLQAIQTVLKGNNYYCNEIALTLLTQARESDGAKRAARYHLSAREIEVLFLIADGMSNAAIAQKLFLARRTIDTHRQNLLRKLPVKNTAGLVRFAIELKLLK